MNHIYGDETFTARLQPGRTYRLRLTFWSSSDDERCSTFGMAVDIEVCFCVLLLLMMMLLFVVVVDMVLMLVVVRSLCIVCCHELAHKAAIICRQCLPA
jgi:hypothetical protein